jgi:FAD/FMN-containing dehydrogenase
MAVVEADIAELQKLLGKKTVQLPAEAFFEKHMRDTATVAPPDAKPLGLALPSSTEEVSRILAWCSANGVPVVPQGGMTGLVGGAVPGSTPALLLNMERMRGVEELDAGSATMTVRAGTTLQEVQTAADEAGFLFPLDLGGRSAHIAGNASTNAGGNRVLRFGMMRDLILGVEAVLADGSVLTNLTKFMKNNTGYDIKQLFIGSEGTLGVITRLVLKLYPKPKSQCLGLVAVKDYAAILALLGRVKSGFAGQLSAFEVMWPDFYRTGTSALGRTPPIPMGHGAYVLIESMGGDPDADQARFEAVIHDAQEAGVVEEAVIAKSVQQTKAIWAIRDCPGEFTAAGHNPQLGFDVSIPTSQIGDFAVEVDRRLKARWPEMKVLYFGHAADGNLHVSVHLDDKVGTEEEMDHLVYDLVGEWNGSISAEHGIGLHKRPFLSRSRSEAELALMRTLKAAMDPKGILNPGKVL